MPLETNFNASPYFDDYNPDNNYYRILFKPSVAVQTRELTQLQTILQDQIDKFGRHVFKDGSIIEGCTVTYDNHYEYVKLQDIDVNGSVLRVNDYIGNKLVNAANLQAIIVNSVPGLEANDPDLNTIYVRYLNSALYANGVQQKTFDPSESVFVRTTDDVSIANVFVAASSYNPIGKGYAVSVNDGVIFKDGFFVKVVPQTAIVSKYDTTPDDLAIGFDLIESIVTSDSDEALYDNAIGAPNYNAPGASRLKLTASLVSRVSENTSTTSATSNTNNFFSLVNFKGGVPAIVYTDPQYSRIGTEMARRTFEESGNYIVDPFELSVASNTTNSNNLVLEVDKGLGYVQGYRVEFSDKNRISIRKGIDTSYFPNQIITANYGNYVYVSELCGPFDIFNLDEVELYYNANAGSAHVSNNDYGSASAPTTKIGTAKIRSIEYYSGTPGTPSAQYKMYLFDIKITSGNYSFADTRVIYATDGSAVKAFADPVLVSGEAVLRETASRDMVFKLGRNAVKTINTTASSFTYRTSTSRVFQANGTATITPPSSHAGGTDTIATTGALSESNESRFVVVPNTSTRAVNTTGTATITSGESNVTGTSTSFNTEYVIGDWIYIGNTSVYQTNRVTAITNSTFMTVSNNFSASLSTNGVSRYFPAGVPISFAREDSANISISVDGSTGTLNLGTSLTSTFSATIYYDVFRNQSTQAAKVVNKNIFVKIAANTHPNKTTGPWSLGLSNVIKIRGIYQGNTYANTNPNYMEKFVLDTGQRDGHYGLASLSLKSGTGYTIGANDLLLIEVDHLTPDYSGGIGYFSINSYPIDDLNTSNTSAIQTAQIPVFTSETGTAYDLRDCIDFRPYANNTANSATVIANATVNPNTDIVLKIDADGAYSIKSDSNFNTAFSYYLGRKDKIALSPEGKINVLEGVSSTEPATPRDLDGTMTLGVLSIPPYPSLSQEDVRTFNRQDYGVTVDLQQYRRYTMRDIGVLDQKFARLEYYTTLSLLEASARSLIIKDDAGSERFKNGFIVDQFKGFSVGDTSNPEFKAAIDYKVQELAPTINRNFIDLDFNQSNSTNVTKTGSIIHINANSVPYIQQTFASKVRNCVENIIYVWNGNITLDPPGDAGVDVDTKPDIVGNIDLSGITTLVNSMPNLIGTERILSTTTALSTSLNSSVNNNADGGRTITDTRNITATNITTTNRTDLDFSASTVTNSFNFGELVQDVSIQLYMRPRRVRFTASGLKPNTIMYPFFDGVAVSQYCTPTTSSFVTSGSIGSTLTSDNNGFIYGIFDIPARTFKVGDRIFRLADASNLTTDSATITSQAAGSYTASNISITKARYALNTRLPQIAVTSVNVSNTIISSRLVSSTTTTSVIPPPRPPAQPTPPPAPRVDPIAQSFFVDDGTDNSGIFIKKIDVFFKTKHPTLGVELQVRYMDNGSPTTKIVPFGRKILTSAQVNTSTNSSTATTFEFDSPVFLQTGEEYCFVVMPVGNNDGYTIWVGEIGQTDVLTNTPIYVNNGTGVLFTSSTNTIWIPYQKEDIKFIVHLLEFSSTSATITYNNSNDEFFTANNFYGDFKIGEKLYVSNGTVVMTSNASGDNTANAVGVYNNASPNAVSLFSASNTGYVYITSNTGSVTDVRYITSIPNTTHIVLNAPLSFTDPNCSIGYVASNGNLFGYVSRVAASQNLLYSSQSTANSTVGFGNVVTGSANALLIGAESGAKANLVSVDSVTYSVVIPQFSYITPAGTSAGLRMKGMSSNTLDSSFTDVSSDIEAFFTDKERTIMSRSLELQNGGAKSLVLSVPLTTTNVRLSPVFDDIKSNILAIKNVISNTASLASETSSSGGTTSAKYISKRVVLAEGQDAEDLQVYLSAYKPANTNITVYTKILNSDDGETIDNKTWTPLSQNTAASVISSRIDRNDFKEFIYDVPFRYSVNAASTTAMGDYSIYGTFANTAVGSNNVISISNTTPLNPGDLVYFIGVSVATGIANGFYNIYSANTTAIQLSNTGSSTVTTVTAISSANTGTLYYVPQTAFKDRNQSNTISYYTKSGAHYHSYKTFSIKIAMTSDEGSHIVPRVSVMRAIALQV